MNVLVTGGTGYIGSHTALLLSEAGYNVTLYDNLCRSASQVAKRLRAISGHILPLVVGDMRNTPLLTRTLLEKEVSAVVHCAGFKSLEAAAIRPLDAYAHNTQGMLSLLQAMAVMNDPVLVFSSSAAVYGDSFAVLQDERHPTAPTSPLGRSLLQAETLLADAIAADATLWRAAILRCFHPCGAHDSGLISDSGQPCAADGFLTKLGRVAAGEASFVSLHKNYADSPDGTAVRDRTHVMDIARGHLAALNYLLESPGLHTFNLGRGQAVTQAQTVSAYEAVCGKPIPVRACRWEPEETSRAVANCQRAEQLLGWKASHSLASICASSWNHMLTLKLVNAPARSDASF